MLANGIILGYSTSGSSYTNLEGLQEVPEIGSEPEKVDATTLADKAKKYEQGIGDYLTYGQLLSILFNKLHNNFYFQLLCNLLLNNIDFY